MRARFGVSALSRHLPTGKLAAAATVGAIAAAVLPCTVLRAQPLAEKRELIVGLPHVPAPYQAGTKFRTPESMAAALAEDILQRWNSRPAWRRADASDRSRLLASREMDLIFATLPAGDALQRSANFIPVGYAAGPMAIMRTDTTIRNWADLKGRTVCVTEHSLHAGMPSRSHGAIEKRYPAPADSLLALRIGQCDAAVHDSTLLEELIRLPEWKKFSARLPTGSESTLGIFLPRVDAETKRALQAIVADWRRSGHLQQLNSKRARQIAFEVYLDQDVPDCH